MTRCVCASAADGSWTAFIARRRRAMSFTSKICRLLRRRSASALAATARQQWQRRLDLGRRALFRIVWLEFGRRSAKPRILIVAHHLVVDGVSLRILLEDMEMRLPAGEERASDHAAGEDDLLPDMGATPVADGDSAGRHRLLVGARQDRGAAASRREPSRVAPAASRRRSAGRARRARRRGRCCRTRRRPITRASTSCCSHLSRAPSAPGRDRMSSRSISKDMGARM